MEEVPQSSETSSPPKNPKLKSWPVLRQAGFGRWLIKDNGVLAWSRVNTSRLGKAVGWLENRRKWALPGTALLVALLLIVLELGHLLLHYQPPLSPLERGRQFYNSGQYTAAAGELRQELQLNPRNYEAKFLLAQDLVALRQWPAASAYLNELLHAAPNDPRIYYWIGLAQLGNGQPDSAAASWNLVISRGDEAARPVQPRAQAALGALRFRQGQYGEASRLLYAALSGPPGLETAEQQQAFYLYGLLLARDLRFDDARNPLQLALNARLPGNQWDNASLQTGLERTALQARTLLEQLPLAAAEKVDGAKRARLAYAYLLAEEYPAAEEQLAQVLQVAPAYTDARAYLGIVYWRTGRIEKARTALDAALALAPANRLARQSLAELIIDQLPGLQLKGEDTESYRQEVERARVLLESLIAEKPGDATLQVTLARFHIARHDYQQAQHAYKAALEFNRQKPVAGLNPGAALSRYYSEIAFDPCVRGVDNGLEATQTFAADPESWYAAGLAYSLCGHYTKAAPFLEKSLELRPYWPPTMYRLAVAYAATQRTAQADRLYSLLADLAPDQVYQRR